MSVDAIIWYSPQIFYISVCILMALTLIETVRMVKGKKRKYRV